MSSFFSLSSARCSPVILQLHIISDELGEGDDTHAEADEYRRRITGLHLADVYKRQEENSLMLCAGQGAYEDDAKADTQALADVLAAQGLPAHLEVWGGDVSHEWYWWGKMLSLFVPRILEK